MTRLSYLGIFSFFISCLYLYFAIILSNYSYKEILREEISKEYNVNISIITTDTLGFFLCERSDYKSQICKEYISYFISKEVRYKQELEKAKKQEMQEIEEKKEKETQTQRLKEEEKKNFKNRIWHIIKATKVKNDKA